MQTLNTYTPLISPQMIPGTVNGLSAARPVVFGMTAPAVDQVRFAGTLIADDVYDLFHAMPKTELHLHESGSADIGFLRHGLIKGIKKGRIKVMKVVHKDGSVENIDVTQMDYKQLWELLSEEFVRRYFRAFTAFERNKEFADVETIAEDGRTPTVSEMQEESTRASRLQAYRDTSAKINPIVKNLPAANILALNYAQTAIAENVRYAEYRVSYTGHKNYQGKRSDYPEYTLEELLDAVNNGFQDARFRSYKQRKDFDYGIIVLLERQGENKVQEAVDVAKEVVRLKKLGKFNIAGVDLAGDEANNAVSEFEEAFRIIRDYNATVAKTRPEDVLGITIHAGETKKSGHLKEGWQSIEEAIRVGWDENTPFRIGHGIQLVYSSPELLRAFTEFLRNPEGWEQTVNKQRVIEKSPLLKAVIDKGIALEMCPKSNTQTYAVHGYRNHPAIFLSRLGAKVTVSTDNRTISNSDVTNEYVKLYQRMGGSYDDIKKMVLDGFETMFVMDKNKKAAMVRDAKEKLAALERRPDMRVAIYKTRHNGESPRLHQFLWITLVAHLKNFWHNITRFYQAYFNGRSQ